MQAAVDHHFQMGGVDRFLNTLGKVELKPGNEGQLDASEVHVLVLVPVVSQ